ncbi:MAG TPA: hypothetical protein VF868_16040 [Bacteroidia bacterium]
MKKTRLILFYIFLILLLIGLGYYRDFVFKSTHALLRAWDLETDYYIHPSLSFLENYEYETIVNLKWVFTILFSIAYLSATLIAVKFIFHNKKFMIITVWVYTGIVLLSGLLMLIGIISGSTENMYEFARYFMGMAQSPLILMILFPLFKLAEKENLYKQQ